MNPDAADVGGHSDFSHDAVRVFPAKPESVRRAREFCAAALVKWGHSDVVDDVTLVVSELATNAVVHARTYFGVLLAVVPGHVQITVRDESGGPLLPRLQHDDALSGRGLFIVAALTSGWGVRDDTGGKATWARLPLPPVRTSGPKPPER